MDKDEEHISPPSNSGRAGLGYSPSNYREGASEDKKVEWPIQCHGRRWSTRKRFGACVSMHPGTGLSNWTEEDVASDVYYAMYYERLSRHMSSPGHVSPTTKNKST
ncbi:hypothetical protein Lal_00035542 [Lupinus albus]|nr:hypothetical protein Lal_00035542 [Lupinus albus]